MARGELTFRDSQGTLPRLVVRKYPEGGQLTKRGTIQKRKYDRKNLLGAAIVNGPAYASTFFWPVTARMIDGDLALLNRYVTLQNNRDYLLMDDEYNDIPTEEITGHRELISGSTELLPTSYDDTITTSVSLARFRVLIVLPEGHYDDICYSDRDRQRWSDVTFSIFELPEVVL
jgi:hypothetical protein